MSTVRIASLQFYSGYFGQAGLVNFGAVPAIADTALPAVYSLDNSDTLTLTLDGRTVLLGGVAASDTIRPRLLARLIPTHGPVEWWRLIREERRDSGASDGGPLITATFGDITLDLHDAGPLVDPTGVRVAFTGTLPDATIPELFAVYGNATLAAAGLPTLTFGTLDQTARFTFAWDGPTSLYTVLRAATGWEFKLWFNEATNQLVLDGARQLNASAPVLDVSVPSGTLRQVSRGWTAQQHATVLLPTEATGIGVSETVLRSTGTPTSAQAIPMDVPGGGVAGLGFRVLHADPTTLFLRHLDLGTHLPVSTLTLDTLGAVALSHPGAPWPADGWPAGTLGDLRETVGPALPTTAAEVATRWLAPLDGVFEVTAVAGTTVTVAPQDGGGSLADRLGGTDGAVRGQRRMAARALRTLPPVGTWTNGGALTPVVQESGGQVLLSLWPDFNDIPPVDLTSLLAVDDVLDVSDGVTPVRVRVAFVSGAYARLLTFEGTLPTLVAPGPFAVGTVRAFRPSTGVAFRMIQAGVGANACTVSDPTGIAVGDRLGFTRQLAEPGRPWTRVRAQSAVTAYGPMPKPHAVARSGARNLLGNGWLTAWTDGLSATPGVQDGADVMPLGWTLLGGYTFRTGVAANRRTGTAALACGGATLRTNTAWLALPRGVTQLSAAIALRLDQETTAPLTVQAFDMSGGGRVPLADPLLVLPGAIPVGLWDVVRLDNIPLRPTTEAVALEIFAGTGFTFIDAVGLFATAESPDAIPEWSGSHANLRETLLALDDMADPAAAAGEWSVAVRDLWREDRVTHAARQIIPGQTATISDARLGIPTTTLRVVRYERDWRRDDDGRITLARTPRSLLDQLGGLLAGRG